MRVRSAKRVRRVPTLTVTRAACDFALLAGAGDRPPEVVAELERRFRDAIVAGNVSGALRARKVRYGNAWLEHPAAPRAPLVFNYMMKARPRHLWNPSFPFSDNFIGVTPLPGVAPAALFALLNATSVCLALLASSRRPGYGLAKLQLIDYRKVSVSNITRFPSSIGARLSDLGRQLVEAADLTAVLSEIDETVYFVTGHKDFAPANLAKELRVALGEMRAAMRSMSSRDTTRAPAWRRLDAELEASKNSPDADGPSPEW
jgi:hypothetical protein